MESLTAIHQRHLRLSHDLTAEGGSVLLITDFASSDTAPSLPTLTGKNLAFQLQQMISQQNFFTGLNPFRLQALLSEDPHIATNIHTILCEQPWLWNLGQRHYPMTAIRFQKKKFSGPKIRNRLLLRQMVQVSIHWGF